MAGCCDKLDRIFNHGDLSDHKSEYLAPGEGGVSDAENGETGVTQPDLLTNETERQWMWVVKRVAEFWLVKTPRISYQGSASRITELLHFRWRNTGRFLCGISCG